MNIPIKISIFVIFVIIFFFIFLTFVLKRDLVSNRGILAPNRFALQNLRREEILSVKPENAVQFSEQVSEGTGLPDPGKPSIWKYYASPDSTEKMREYYHAKILELGWQVTGRTPAGTARCSFVITEPNGICGLIYFKGQEELWLQILSTDKTQNAGGKSVPAGNKSVVILSITFN